MNGEKPTIVALAVLVVVVGGSGIALADGGPDSELPNPEYPHIENDEVRLVDHSTYGEGGCVFIDEAGEWKVAMYAGEYTDYIYDNTDISKSRSWFSVYVEIIAHIPAKWGSPWVDHPHFDDTACMYRYEVDGASDAPN